MVSAETRWRPRPTLGLVLGAGGVRGCAHAGVFEVLDEAGITVDIVVGASIGAMMGLGIAAGLPASYITGVVRDARAIDVFRFYAGRLKSTRSNPIGRMLLDAGEGKTFADLEKPFAVVGTDMNTGKPCVIDSGPVLPAVQASMALPFIARPVPLHGTHYADGGMTDTAPVHVARAMGADRVIAICLGGNFAAPRFVQRRAWTRPVLQRLGTQRRPVAGNLGDSIRFLCRLYLQALDPPHPAEDADIAIWPSFGRIEPNSMIGSSFCYEQGKRATREALPAIREMLAGWPTDAGQQTGDRAIGGDPVP